MEVSEHAITRGARKARNGSCYSRFAAFRDLFREKSYMRGITHVVLSYAAD